MVEEDPQADFSGIGDDFVEDLKSVKAVGLGLVGVLEQATKPISKKPTVAKDSQVMLFALIPTEKD